MCMHHYYMYYYCYYVTLQAVQELNEYKNGT